MISREKLRDMNKDSSLHMYQQEKDYLIKVFLFYYFRRYDSAIFKGGTCIRYLYETDRFSEDIDFNLTVEPNSFQNEVRKTLKEFEKIDIECGFIKEETFEDAYTADIWFYGPLHEGTEQTRNKFRIDAGKRGGTILDPRWVLIDSGYPETKEKFLVQTMDEYELLVEKVITMLTRSKGRDLYDIWYLLKSGTSIDVDLFQKKYHSLVNEGFLKDEISWESYLKKEEYERDMEKLAPKIVPYEQVKKEVEEHIEDLKKAFH
ncbi:MAG: nucleotidyl transferase AbiEii/AbiGii toxin family protein [Candidatus Thermoplasmatota archaeon]|nr:nucleotidyl transferase AbiEii/AbiGii toxin family protein [Candidatus Thermoplasmatota archaeon]